MTVTVEAVQAALSNFIDPNTQKDSVSTRSVKNLRVEDGKVTFDIELGYPAKTQIDIIRAAVVDVVKVVPGVTAVEAKVSVKIVAHAVQRNLKPLPGVKNIIAVASGKGGVGKSLVASLLCQYLIEQGREILAFDTDPLNQTLTGYKDLPVKELHLMKGDDIDRRRFDQLIEDILTAPGDVVVDNGAASFVPLSAYLKENQTIDFIEESGIRVLIHTVFTGGQAHHGREDDVAGPEEQGKGHETKGKNVPGLEFFHTRRLRRAALARPGAVWNQGKFADAFD